MTEETELKPLSKKDEQIMDEYFICGVQWRAYKKVHPKPSDEVARTLASRLFANDNFKAHLARRYEQYHVTANEALKLQSDIARGDITDLLTPLGQIDIKLIRERGLGRLIKKIKQETITKIGKKADDEDVEIHKTEIEMYPADVAQERLLRVHEKIKEPTKEITITINRASDGSSINDK